MNAVSTAKSNSGGDGNFPRQVNYGNIRFADPIFDSIRTDYANFDDWVRKCRNGRAVRHAFVFEDNEKKYSGIAIIKLGETADGPDPAGMKISTFKISSTAEGVGMGDKLMEAVFQFAILSEIEHIFITVPPMHEDLVRFLERVGFRRHHSSISGGEQVYSADLSNLERMYLHLNRLAYDMLAPEYEARSNMPGPSQEAPESLAKMLMQKIPGPAQRVLELGPGSGSVLHALSKVSEQSIAVEVSPAMAKLASKQAPKSTVIIADALEIEFPEHHFDGIFAGAFLHLFPKKEAQRMLQKMAIWTKPNGAIFVNSSIAEKSKEGLEDKMDYMHRVARFRARWTEDEFIEMIESSGLNIVGREETHELERKKYWLALICKPCTTGGSN